MNNEESLHPRPVTIEFDIPDGPLPEPMTENVAVEYILASLCGGPLNDLKRAFDTLQGTKSYRRMISAAIAASDMPEDFRAVFHLNWTVRGFRWREAINDDALMRRALRAVLSPYNGPGLTLYRGEQARRFDFGELGFNWTPKREVAEMFASGLCSLYHGGGILLTATAPPAAIIAAPSAHSRYLGEEEYVIEPGLLEAVTELRRHPQTT